MNKRRISNSPEENLNTNVFRRQIMSRNINDDSTPAPPIFEMSKEERMHYLNNHPNPMGYPTDYLNIYNREKQIRRPIGYDGLINITNSKIFIKGPEQRVNSTRIQQVTNVNCIKSNKIDEFNFGRIALKKKFRDRVEKFGIKMFPDKERYLMGEDYGFEFGEDDMENINDNGFEEPIKSGSNDETFMVYYPDYKEDKLVQLICLFKAVLEEYEQYVVIAGGFALSLYLYENYGYATDFSDIDLFIHSCDEITANKIVKLLSEITENKCKEIDNVVSSSFNQISLNRFYYECSYEEEFKPLIVQIIKRLYSSPAEIIYGFDVDCCCILVNFEGQIWTTERGYYSIQHGYNTVNFEKLSPSYHFRLCKYRNRGFGIWIPHVEYFKKNAVFDVNFLDYTSLVNILIKKDSVNKKYDVGFSDYNDFYRMKKSKKINSKDLKYITFKTINPGEQIINTFNRIIMDDPINWYPTLPPGTIDFYDLQLTREDPFVEINTDIFSEPIFARNIKRERKLKFNNDRKKNTLYYLITEITKMYPDTIIGGTDVNSVVFPYDIKFPYYMNVFSPSLTDDNSKNLFLYHFVLLRLKCYINNTKKMDNPNANLYDNIGIIKFLDYNKPYNYDDVLYMTEEESFENFKKINRGYIVGLHLNEPNFNHHFNKRNFNFINFIVIPPTYDEKFIKPHICIVSNLEEINILDPNITFENHLIQLNKPEIFYRNGKIYGRHNDILKLQCGIEEPYNVVLPYNVLDNYFPTL